jgi:hypothetical protein
MGNVPNFVPQIWSTKILRTLEDNLVAKKICNLKSEGEIKKHGDTVHFPGLADPTITAYTSADISYEALSDASMTLTIDQQNYFAFYVQDIDKAQAEVDLKGSQAERAGYGLRKTADAYVLGLYAGATGGTVTDATCTSATIFSDIGGAQQLLAEQNVPEEQMWMVIPPWIQLKLKLAGIKFQINNGINGSGGMAWTKDLGFDIFVTNQVTNLGTAAAPQSECLAGSYNAIVYDDQILETESLRLEKRFDTAVRGLHVYGAKVIKPKELVLLNMTYAAETAI